MALPVSGSRPAVYRPPSGRPSACGGFPPRWLFVLPYCSPPLQQHNIPQKGRNSQANGAELTEHYHLPFLSYSVSFSIQRERPYLLFYAAQYLRTLAGGGCSQPKRPRSIG